MVGDVEAFALEVPSMAQRDDRLHQAQADPGSEPGPADRHADRSRLPHQLSGEAVIRAAMAAERRNGDDRGADRSRDPPEPVNSEHIEAVVEPEPVLDRA